MNIIEKVKSTLIEEIKASIKKLIWLKIFPKLK